MGGWRKLWFVLQNQLLLSYSSKDDYEKKLAPFKDVVSLVPGTTIRPTKGPRFIIETTTNLMLTYVSMSMNQKLRSFTFGHWKLFIFEVRERSYIYPKHYII